MIPYKMKYWREYYLAKHIEKHFGGINIGDLDKNVSYMRLNCCSGLILMCACFPSGVVTSVVDMEAEAPRETCAYVVESCIRGHHVSKDFWTPLINEVLVCAQENENPLDLYAVAVKCLHAFVAPFSATYLSISALSLSEYWLYPWRRFLQIPLEVASSSYSFSYVIVHLLKLAL